MNSKIKANLNFDAETVLDNAAQTQVKGGILLYCEEKRIGLVTMPVMKIAPDGKKQLTLKM